MRAIQRPLDEKLADPFGDQRGLFLALDLDRHFIGLLPLARALLFEFEQLHMAAHALARADGGEEADLVAAIVDAHLDAFDPGPVGARAEHRDQRERQEAVRSEEHTSELQSLMRTSYAVFCLKNK